MRPDQPLPCSKSFDNAEEYVSSLLVFAETNDLLHTLCGGVHILDFFTSTPDLYSRVLPQEWRDFFCQHDIMDVLDLLMREDLDQFANGPDDRLGWREGPPPPLSLVQYLQSVRLHLLNREPASSQCSRNRAMKPTQKLARHVSVGMNVKKVHEVGIFASYLDEFTSSMAETTGTEISHLVDFGSGQNYLGRALASQPYNKHIVAIESKGHNQERAKDFDVMARLRKKKLVIRNKKAFRAGLEGQESASELSTPNSERDAVAEQCDECAEDEPKATVEISAQGIGTIQYIEHRIQDGNISNVIDQIVDPSKRSEEVLQPSGSEGFVETQISLDSASPTAEKNVVVMSLHSCGNLVHHGLRSLILNPSVRAVAMIGCCYNLITERLRPATYKLPELRPHAHPRLEKAGMACDPHGFPMSERLCQYGGEGVNLNITARMMAVQAPQNWGVKDSEGFFTRHFYRALLQRVFLDRGIVSTPSAECVGGSPLGHSSGTPIIIGSLRKSCYDSFVNYVRGALAKLYEDPERGHLFREKMQSMTDTEIEQYAHDYAARKHELSVIWSLMAFSAGVVEAIVVVDRWLWLKEQKEVKEAWVEPVFDYRLSPRNLVIVGIK